jgi:hypothetical protein
VQQVSEIHGEIPARAVATQAALVTRGLDVTLVDDIGRDVGDVLEREVIATIGIQPRIFGP